MTDNGSANNNRDFNRQWKDRGDNRGRREFGDRGRRFDRDNRDNRDDRGGRRFDRDDRGGRGFNRDDRGGRGYNRDNRGWRGDRDNRGYNRDDRGGRRFDRDDRGGRRFDRDDRGGRGYNRDNRGWRGDRDNRGYNRDDRGGRRFDRDDRGGRRFDRDDRGGRGYNRDNRGWRGDRDNRGYNRDDRGGRRFDRDDRGGRGYNRDNRGWRGDRGGRDNRFDRGDRRFNRDDRGGRSFDRDNRGDRKFNRDDRQEQTGQQPVEAFAAHDKFDQEFDEPTNMIDGLLIPEGLEATELDASAFEALATLGERNQEAVAKLLVMAGQLIDLDPELAYSYAQAAVKRAGRVDLVREAAALTAYATDRYAEALREVRAVRRMRNDFSLRAVEADCERGLGKPEKAIELIDETDLSGLDLSEQVELVLVSAGARFDLNEPETALILVDDALAKLGEDADEQMQRRLMLAKVEYLRALERDEEADEVEAIMPPEEEDNDILDIRMLAEADIDDRRSDLKGSLEPLSERYDTLLLDLDGVCYMGKNPVEHAAESVSAAVEGGMKHAFVTNNSSRPPQAIADQLTELGFPAEANEIMTSAMDAIAMMKDELEAGAKVFVIGGQGLREAVTNGGFELVDSADDQPDAVVQGFDRSVDWEMLSEGALAINAGARFFATNLDASLPVERGFALGNGALVRAVRHATNKKPMAAGKPLPGIFQRAIELVGGERAVAIGDRLETDISGALSASVPSMHVLTGVHDAKAVILADRGLRPQFVHLDMRGLGESHPRPQHHRDGTWSCGVGQIAKVERGYLTLDGVVLDEDVTVTLDSYRALIAAAWDQATEGPKVICPTITVVANDDPAGIVTAPEPSDEDTESDAETNDSAEDDTDDSDVSQADLDAVDVEGIPEYLPGEEELEALMEETAHLENETDGADTTDSDEDESDRD